MPRRDGRTRSKFERLLHLREVEARDGELVASTVIVGSTGRAIRDRVELAFVERRAIVDGIELAFVVGGELVCDVERGAHGGRRRRSGKRNERRSRNAARRLGKRDEGLRRGARRRSGLDRLDVLLHRDRALRQIDGAHVVACRACSLGRAPHPDECLAPLPSRPKRGRGLQTPDDIFVVVRLRFWQEREFLPHRVCSLPITEQLRTKKPRRAVEMSFWLEPLKPGSGWDRRRAEADGAAGATRAGDHHGRRARRHEAPLRSRKPGAWLEEATGAGLVGRRRERRPWSCAGSRRTRWRVAHAPQR